MQSIDLIRSNLVNSRNRVLARVEDMRGYPLVPSTPAGGPHTLWVLGHLAYIESLVVSSFMLGEGNPLAEWEGTFDGAEVSADPAIYPPFDAVLARCTEARESTLALLRSFSEADLDTPSVKAPGGPDDVFATRRHCLQYCADHWYMHRGHLADARRAAGVGRSWY